MGIPGLLNKLILMIGKYLTIVDLAHLVSTSVVHEPSGLESFESARVSWRLESLGGRRRCVGTVVVPRAQLHTEQEKIFTSVVDTWRVGINQQYLYSIGEYLIFA